MTHQEIYEELKLLSQEIGLVVRLEIGDFEGGLCKLKDQTIILVNRRHPLPRRVSVVARSLHEAGLEDVYVKPALREIIEDEVAMMAAGNKGKES